MRCAPGIFTRSIEGIFARAHHRLPRTCETARWSALALGGAGDRRIVRQRPRRLDHRLASSALDLPVVDRRTRGQLRARAPHLGWPWECTPSKVASASRVRGWYWACGAGHSSSARPSSAATSTATSPKARWPTAASTPTWSRPRCSAPVPCSRRWPRCGDRPRRPTARSSSPSRTSARPSRPAGVRWW